MCVLPPERPPARRAVPCAQFFFWFATSDLARAVRAPVPPSSRFPVQAIRPDPARPGAENLDNPSTPSTAAPRTWTARSCPTSSLRAAGDRPLRSHSRPLAGSSLSRGHQVPRAGPGRHSRRRGRRRGAPASCWLEAVVHHPLRSWRGRRGDPPPAGRAELRRLFVTSETYRCRTPRILAIARSAGLAAPLRSLQRCGGTSGRAEKGLPASSTRSATGRAFAAADLPELASCGHEA